jgi:hypothetical protein
MVTGDQPTTAQHIGQTLGLTEEGRQVIYGKDLKDVEDLSPEEKNELLRAPIFARVSPEQKLDIIGVHQEKGSVVAMTGDGVNDAPALKKADIGVAMGQRGTQVAKEAADMVLKDDAFETILIAIEQGRAIFNNIRKFILFLLSGNVAEIMIVAAAMLAGAPLPILPLQILYLNMIGDVFPALALGVGPGDPANMKRPPPGRGRAHIDQGALDGHRRLGIVDRLASVRVSCAGIELAGYEREAGRHGFISHPCICQAVACIQYEGQGIWTCEKRSHQEPLHLGCAGRMHCTAGGGRLCPRALTGASNGESGVERLALDFCH